MQVAIEARDRVGILAAAGAAASYTHPRLQSSFVHTRNEQAHKSEVEIREIEQRLRLTIEAEKADAELVQHD